ncbi:hypothetical protein [Vibrio nigripulchritudo]|uniref:hypothetical protein n=1 Tax=Vibrio nigripulchritudo TaxID=28173 RepID=UPI001EF668F5|nr:hypothetical protein [Vibrio nigripulchritudo]
MSFVKFQGVAIIMNRLFLILVVLFSSHLYASGYVGSEFTSISFVTSYNQYGPGDVAFKIKTPISQCPDGYWITKADPGFQANLSMLIAAFQAKSNVRIYGLPSQKWAGSSGTFCKLYSIEYHE